MPQMLDPTNRAIIRCLQRDGRATFAEVGDQVNLSAAAVKRRVDGMRARGEISGFTVVTNPEAMGWGIEAYIEIYCRGNVPSEALRAEFSVIEEVQELVTVTGDADAMVRIMAGTMTDLERVVETIRDSGKIDRTRTMMVMSRAIDRHHG
ncbi:MAG: Lrp/AsnC family transcriptional regulator [Cellulomonadaceae bacterium]|nr:Lrp/AsnC family transcriptional regulator [Cellulomonadaceae bacterium]